MMAGTLSVLCRFCNTASVKGIPAIRMDAGQGPCFPEQERLATLGGGGLSHEDAACFAELDRRWGEVGQTPSAFLRQSLGERTDLFQPGSSFPRAKASLSQGAQRLLEERSIRLRVFHRHHLPETRVVREEGGGRVEVRHRPYQHVGILLPKAKLPVSTLLSLVCPPQVAGVDKVSIALGLEEGEQPSTGFLAACEVLGIQQLVRRGGAEGVFILSEGLGLSSPCDLILGGDGPSSSWAMKHLGGRVRVLPMGGGEDLLLIADRRAEIDSLLVDEILLHAELHEKGRCVLFSNSEEYLRALGAALGERVDRLPRGRKAAVKDVLKVSVERVLVPSLRRAFELLEQFYPKRILLRVQHSSKWMAHLPPCPCVQIGASSSLQGSFLSHPWVHPPLGSIEGFFSPKFFLKPMSIMKEREEEISDKRWGYWKEIEEVPAVLLPSRPVSREAGRRGRDKASSKVKGERG